MSPVRLALYPIRITSSMSGQEIASASGQRNRGIDGFHGNSPIVVVIRGQ